MQKKVIFDDNTEVEETLEEEFAAYLNEPNNDNSKKESFIDQITPSDDSESFVDISDELLKKAD
jgi:hypothetical protein